MPTTLSFARLPTAQGSQIADYLHISSSAASMAQVQARLLLPAMRSRQVCYACSRATTQPRQVASTSTTSRRDFASSARLSAKLIERKLEKDDPLDMANLEEFKFDDIPWQGHLKLEKDRERLHLLRLIEFQFPKIRSE